MRWAFAKAMLAAGPCTSGLYFIDEQHQLVKDVAEAVGDGE
jgi:hypothetical protein